MLLLIQHCFFFKKTRIWEWESTDGSCRSLQVHSKCVHHCLGIDKALFPYHDFFCAPGHIPARTTWGWPQSPALGGSWWKLPGIRRAERSWWPGKWERCSSQGQKLCSLPFCCLRSLAHTAFHRLCTGTRILSLINRIISREFLLPFSAGCFMRVTGSTSLW